VAAPISKSRRGFGASSPAFWMRRGADALLAISFMIAGLLKMSDFAAFTETVETLQPAPASWAPATAHFLLWWEFLTGALLISGWHTQLARWLVAGTLTLYTTALFTGWMRGLEMGCGCFGDGSLGFAGSIVRNLLLLAVAGALWGFSRRVS